MKTLTLDVIEASRVHPGQSIVGFDPNRTGGVLIRPGGRDGYPSFWVRDFALSIDSGLIPPEEVRHALIVTARTQQQGRVDLPTGSWIPDGAVADHVNFTGEPIFFPGTYDSTQQGGLWGRQPPFGDHFLFTHIAWYAIVQQGQEDLLHMEVEGQALFERLAKAFHVAMSCPQTPLVHCGEEDRGVNFGFYDIVIHTGKLFFASVLKYRCANELAELYRLAGEETAAQRYDKIARQIRMALSEEFPWREGLPTASTGLSAQPDVWGAAYAVYMGAIEGEARQTICQTLAKDYRQETIAYRGNIRHVPTTADFNDARIWERIVPGQAVKTRYQNGAYWGTPTGWVCYAIAQVAESLAARLAGEYLAELREGDFRQGPEFGSPWECFHPQNDHRQNPVYLTSVACPYAAFRRLGWGA